MADSYLVLGRCSKSKGLKGELRVQLELAHYPKSDSIVYFEMSGAYVPFAVEETTQTLDGEALIRLKDVNSLEDAQRLIHKRLYIDPKEYVPPPVSFSYLDFDGFTVSDAQLGVLGKILRVDQYPKNWVAALTYKGVEILIPLNDAVVISFDYEEKIVTTSLPDGILDLYLN